MIAARSDCDSAASSLEGGTSSDSQAALPVRMLNEFAYCPRLFHLEWVQGEWRESADTLDGTRVHRRVDRPSRAGLPVPTPAPDGAQPEQPFERTLHARSVDLSDPSLGLVARIDLVEASGDVATPVDYKRGRRPKVPGGAYEPERVQLCAQGLLLRAHGFKADRGVLYFAESKQRVDVEFTEELVARTLELRDTARVTARRSDAPPPLVDSPKCPRCSLAPICLPDEHNALEGRSTGAVRPICSPRDDALPLHVQEAGSTVGKEGEELVVRRKGVEVGRARLIDVSRVNLHSGSQLTTPAIREVLARDIPVAIFSFGGWYAGRIHGHSHKNVLLRLAQFRAATDEARALALARRFICAKIRNCRVLLRRNTRGIPVNVLADLRRSALRTREAKDLSELLGIEGAAARLYFEHFGTMLRGSASEDAGTTFSLEGRNRRPPRDPVNALLSFVYALLAAEWTATVSAIGFDPYFGFLHQPRYGRPALALDLMEEFRPIVADSVVITVLNTGVVQAGDFMRTATAVNLSASARRDVTHAFESRLDELITHPVFGYRVSYRRVLDIQARLLARYLTGEIGTFPEFVTR